MTMSAGNQFLCDAFSSGLLIFDTAGIAESGVASERDKFVTAAIRTYIKRKTIFKFTTTDYFANFFFYNRTNKSGVCSGKGIPVIGKYFFNGKMWFHVTEVI